MFAVIIFLGYSKTILIEFCIPFPKQTRIFFYVSAVQVFLKIFGKRRNCSFRAISPFPTEFSTGLSIVFVKLKIVASKLFQNGQFTIRTMKVFMSKYVYIVCLGFYPVSTVLQLFNGDSSQIHVSWTIFNQYLTSPLS